MNKFLRVLFVVEMMFVYVSSPAQVLPPIGSSLGIVLGSITSRGSVRVGKIPVPVDGMLFSGDRVSVDIGTALIQYQNGPRIVLGSRSAARFTISWIQLEKGGMSFQTMEADTVAILVSTLHIHPITRRVAANTTLDNRQVSVVVTEGILKVVDPSEVELASLKAGDTRLFEEAETTTSSPASAAPRFIPPKKGPWFFGFRRWGPFLIRPTFGRLPAN